MVTMQYSSPSSLLVWGLLALAVPTVTEACSCLREQYQTLFCRADAVIRGTIQSRHLIYGQAAITNNEIFSSSDDSFSEPMPQFAPRYPEYPLFVVYNVTLNAIYKGEEEFVGMTTVAVSSAGSGSMCGITDLQEGTTYVLSGFLWDGEMNIGLCSSWVQPYKELSAFQKRGLRRIYAKTCDNCQVCSARYSDDCRPSTGCIASYVSECVRRNTACVRSSKGKCFWKESKHLRLC